MSEPVLRHATAADTAADAVAIAEIIAAVVSGPNPVGFDEAMPADEVTRWIERLGEAGAIYLAESNGETAGFGALDFDTQTPDTATLGVWLKSNHRRKGIGTRLAEALLQHARDHGFQKVVGRLPDSNEPALSFLSAIGGLVPIINPSMQFELPL